MRVYPEIERNKNAPVDTGAHSTFSWSSYSLRHNEFFILRHQVVRRVLYILSYHLHRRMAEDSLQRDDVASGHEEVQRERMSECMRTDAYLVSDARFHAVLFDAVSNVRLGNRIAHVR